MVSGFIETLLLQYNGRPSSRPVQVFAIPEHFSITRNYDTGHVTRSAIRLFSDTLFGEHNVFNTGTCSRIFIQIINKKPTVDKLVDVHRFNRLIYDVKMSEDNYSVELRQNRFSDCDELVHSPTSILIVRNTNSDSLTIFSENIEEMKRLLKMVETKMWLSDKVQKATIVSSAKFADEFIVLPIVT